MAEAAADVVVDDKKPQPGNIVSAGTPERMDVWPKPTPPEKTEDAGDDKGTGDDKGGAAKGAGDDKNKGAASPAATGDDKGAADKDKKSDPPAGDDKKPVELSDDQLKAFFESKGLKYEGIDSLKEKLSAPAPKTEQTPEEKKAAEQVRESRIAEKHIKAGRPLEQLTAFKTVMAADATALGLEVEVNDLVNTYKISKEQAIELAKDRYFQYSDEEIEAIQDKDEKEARLKEREIGTKKLERKGQYNQKLAKDYLDILSKTIDDEDATKLRMEQHSSKVEDAIKRYQRKNQLDLGQLNDQKIDPIDFDVDDAVMTQVKEVLGDRSKFDNTLLTDDDHLNLDFLLPHLVRSFSYPAAVKKSYLEGMDRTTKAFQAKFGSDIPPLGGEKKPTGIPGKLVEVGQPTVFRPVRQKNN